jgi:hypothetical protein
MLSDGSNQCIQMIAKEYFFREMPTIYLCLMGSRRISYTSSASNGFSPVTESDSSINALFIADRASLLFKKGLLSNRSSIFTGTSRP